MSEELAFEAYEANFVAGCDRVEKASCYWTEKTTSVFWSMQNRANRALQTDKCNGPAYVRDGKISKAVAHNHPACVTVINKKQAVLASVVANPQVATNNQA